MDWVNLVTLFLLTIEKIIVVNFRCKYSSYMSRNKFQNRHGSLKCY